MRWVSSPVIQTFGKLRQVNKQYHCPTPRTIERGFLLNADQPKQVMSLARLPFMSQFDFVPERYPDKPGCYIMRDSHHGVLYVGKSKNLRDRLSSYFQPHAKTGRIRQLVRRIAEIEIILLNNETESLILENSLIDQYRPPYNRSFLRVERGYPYIVLTREEFPRLVPYQKDHVNKELGGALIVRQFGPYLSHRFRDVVLDFVRDHFQLRTCNPLPKEVCLRFHIQKCSGICERRASEDRYAKDVKNAAEFLSSNKPTDLIRQMKHRIREDASHLKFESAQRLKEQIAVLESALEKQVVEREVEYDQDVVYFGDRRALVARIKCGALQGLYLFNLDSGRAYRKVCERFILSHYRSNSPRELIVNRLNDVGEVEEKLTSANGYSVRIGFPRQSVEHELMNLCRINYEYRVSQPAHATSRPIDQVR